MKISTNLFESIEKIQSPLLCFCNQSLDYNQSRKFYIIGFRTASQLCEHHWDRNVTNLGQTSGLMSLIVLIVSRKQGYGDLEMRHSHIEIDQPWYWELPAFVLIGVLLYTFTRFSTNPYIGFPLTVIVVGIVMYYWYKRKKDDKESIENRISGRPFGVTMVGIFSLVNGLIFLLVGTLYIVFPSYYSSLLIDTGDEIRIDSASFTRITSILDGASFQAVGISQIVVALAIWSGKEWAWTSNVVSLVVGILLAALDGFRHGSLGTISLVVLNLALLLYLLSPLVRSYFGKYELSISRKKGWRSLFVMDESKAFGYIQHAWIAGMIYGVLLVCIGGFLLTIDYPDLAAISIGVTPIIFGLVFGLKHKRWIAAISLLALLIVNSAFIVWMFIPVAGEHLFWFFSTDLLGIPLFQGVRATVALRSMIRF